MNQNQLKDAETLLTGAAEPTRRSMLQTAAAASAVLAAAVSGCAAPTQQQTSAIGLDAGNVLIDINGFAMPAYRAAAAGKSNLPVVLVVSEIFGVQSGAANREKSCRVVTPIVGRESLYSESLRGNIGDLFLVYGVVVYKLAQGGILVGSVLVRDHTDAAKVSHGTENSRRIVDKPCPLKLAAQHVKIRAVIVTHQLAITQVRENLSRFVGKLKAP